MAIGHRLKFFTLVNQKIREVKKGMTNGHWSSFKISFHVKNSSNEMMQFVLNFYGKIGLLEVV